MLEKVFVLNGLLLVIGATAAVAPAVGAGGGFGSVGPQEVTIVVSETITVSDAPSVVPPRIIEITEGISVADVPSVVPPPTIEIIEDISVTDVPSVEPAPIIEIIEDISVADVPSVEPAPIIEISEVVAVDDHAALPGVGAVPFTVTMRDDSDDGSCDAAHCSLREAINASNTTSSRDVIAFAIPGDGPHTIRPASALPAIEHPVFIDGYTQSGSSPNTNGPHQGSNAVLMIVLDGSGAGDGVTGLRLWSDDSTVRGLAVHGFDGNGISIVFGDRNRVQGSFIGTDVTGSEAHPNDIGVLISANAEESVVGTDGDGVADMAERNVIAGNLRSGVRIQQGAVNHVTERNVVAGNLIGTDATGMEALPNQVGVTLHAGTNANRIGTDGDGAADAAERNVISGNTLMGVRILRLPTNSTRPERTVVAANYIGADVAGTAPLPNGGVGVLIRESPSNVVEGNVLSGNGGAGIVIAGAEATGNQIASNLIGTDAGGVAPLGNAAGVLVQADASGTIMGGRLLEDGTVEPGPNTIAHNTSEGVRIIGGTGNTILFNSIFENGGLGIDLAGDGVTSNDDGDVDPGPNELQNFPVLTNIARLRSFVSITGTLQSAPTSAFTVQIFSGPACDASLHGEGSELLGQTSVTTDEAGNGVVSETFLARVPFTSFLTATATDEGTGNTSEFSRCRSAAFTVVDAGDQEILDTPLQDGGTRISAASTGGPTAAELLACGVTTLTMTAGDEIELRCGSAGIVVLSGPVEVRLDENTEAIVPTGATVTVEETEEGQLQLENESPEGSDPVQLAVDGTVVGEIAGGTSLGVGTLHVTKAELEVDDEGRVGGKVELEGTFTPGPASDGLDVLEEQILITLGPYAETIPVGAFEVDSRRGGFRYEAEEDAAGVDEVRIGEDGSFKIEAEELDLAGLDLSERVPFALRIGDDLASLAVPFGEDGELVAGLLAAGSSLDVPLRLTPDSLAVIPGQTGVFSVRLGGVFAGRPVSLACEGLPAGTACVFEPATVTPTVEGGTSTLSVRTTGRSRLLGRSGGGGGRPTLPPLWAGALVALLLGLTLAHALPVRRRVILPLTVLVAAGLVAAACGDDPTGPIDSRPTPAGVHTFTVTATAGSDRLSVQARLLVEP